MVLLVTPDVKAVISPTRLPANDWTPFTIDAAKSAPGRLGNVTVTFPGVTPPEGIPDVTGDDGA